MVPSAEARDGIIAEFGPLSVFSHVLTVTSWTLIFSASSACVNLFFFRVFFIRFPILMFSIVQRHSVSRKNEIALLAERISSDT